MRARACVRVRACVGIYIYLYIYIYAYVGMRARVCCHVYVRACVRARVCVRTSLRKLNNPYPPKKASLNPAHLSTSSVGLHVTVVRPYLSLRITINSPNSCHLPVQRRKSLTPVPLEVTCTFSVKRDATSLLKGGS